LSKEELPPKITMPHQFSGVYKINGKWVLAKESRMDCVAVVKENDEVDIKEFRRLETGEKLS
jgi:hypothetical protein